MLPLFLYLAATASSPLPLNKSDWVTTEDYPPEAVRGALHGKTSYRLKVAASGEVTACKITRSSGSPVLDDRTCALMRERARFSLDPAGRRSRKYVGTFAWRLPDETEGANTLVHFSIRNGMTICSIERSSHSRVLVQKACDPLVAALEEHGRQAVGDVNFWLLNSTPLEPEM